jgi:malonyl-CoA/methylmalonyl-CoA synthetase
VTDILTSLLSGANRANRVFLQDRQTPVTYAMARDRAAQYAQALVLCGVGPGDRVAAQVTKSTEALFLYLGCLHLGAVFLPLNPAYTPTETEFFLSDAETTVFVCDPAMRMPLTNAVPQGQILTLTGDRSSLSALADAQRAQPADRLHSAQDLAAILYTSGTTGRPKGVMLSRGNLSSNAATLAQIWHFAEDDILLHALPVFHTHGLFVATNTVLAAGASMRFLPEFQIDAVIAALPDCTVMMGVPTYYTRLLGDARLDRTLTAGMRLFISGSAPLSASVHREWQDRTGHAILERYGMTETNMNTSNPCKGERRPGTVGQPLPGVTLRITDPATGVPLPDGQVGGVEVKGPNVFQGYWRQPEKTASEFSADGFFRTGDMGLVENGYLRLVGRSKDLIISGGLNVYPAEIEDVLDAQPGVAGSAVIGVPHPDFGEAVVAVVTPRPGMVLDTDVLRVRLQDRLANYKRPKHIVIAPDLPRNTMGKVQKNLLRSQWAHLFVP